MVKKLKFGNQFFLTKARQLWQTFRKWLPICKNGCQFMKKVEKLLKEKGIPHVKNCCQCQKRVLQLFKANMVLTVIKVEQLSQVVLTLQRFGHIEGF